MEGRKQVEIIVSAHQATLDVSNLPTGFYLLEIGFPESAIRKKMA